MGWSKAGGGRRTSRWCAQKYIRDPHGNYMSKDMAMCGEVIRLKCEMEAAVRQRFDLVQADRRNRSHTHLTLPFRRVDQKFLS